MPSARDSVAGLGLCPLQFLRQTWVQLAATEPFEPELGVLVGDALMSFGLRDDAVGDDPCIVEDGLVPEIINDDSRDRASLSHSAGHTCATFSRNPRSRLPRISVAA